MQHLRWFARGKTDFDFERKSSFFEKCKSIFTDLLGNWIELGIGSNAIFLYNRMSLLHLTVNCLVRLFFVNMIH